MTFDHMNIWRFPYYINKPSSVQIGLQLFKWGHFHIFSLSYNLTSDDLWPWYMTFDRMNIWRFPYYINKPSLVQIRHQLLKWGHFHIFSLSYNLTSDDLWSWYMTFDCMNIWRFPYYINKPSFVQIRHQLFKWGHFHIFSLSYNLTSDDLWPWYMTFDHMNIWRFPYYINKPSLDQIRHQLFKWGHFHIFSLSYNLTSDDLWSWYMTFDCMNIWRFPHYINQVLFKSDINFSNEAIFTFSAYLTTWPQMTFDLGIWPLTAWTYEGSPIISINQVWIKSDINFSNEAIFTFSAYLTTWPQMTFDLGIWPLTAWTYEGSHIISINQVLFKSDINFSNEAIFTFSAYLTTWPKMTFDLGIWPSTAWTYEGSHIISINQIWFQSDFNFSNEATFTFLAYLTTWPQMTFDLDMWPLTSSTNEGSHVASMTQLWLKSIKACGR